MAKLSQAQREEFDRLCFNNATYKALIDFLAECNAISEPISCENMSNWWNRARPIGSQALQSNQFIRQYLGQAPNNLLEVSAGVTADLIERLINNLSIESVSNTGQLEALVNLTRELRQSSAELIRQRSEADTEALKFDGSQALAKFLSDTFKDTSFEAALAEAILAFYRV